MFEEVCAGEGPLDLLFIDERGSSMHRSQTGKEWFWRAAIPVGLDGPTAHGLRHTAASLAIQSGADVKAVQRLLGHSSTAMTLDLYADLFDDDLDAVANRLDHGLARARVVKMWARPVPKGCVAAQRNPSPEPIGWVPWGVNPRPAEWK